MKIRKTCQILGLLVLVGIIFLTGCRSGGGGGGNGGGGGGPTTSTVIFELPEYYKEFGLDEVGLFRIPEGKEVRFYTLSKSDISQSFLADYYFTGKTGSEKIECILPDSLKGQARYIFTVIFLEDEDSDDRFDPEKKSGQEIMQAAMEGKILFGYASHGDDSPKMHTLAHGVTIKDFDIRGKAMGDQISLIKFNLPDFYEYGGKFYEIPTEKTVKFYALSATGGTKIEADHVFDGTTGDSIICDIPSQLVGQKRYFYVVVELEGDFDLRGKTQEEVAKAAEEGKILFGIAKNDDDDNPKLYTLIHGVTVENNFVFYGTGGSDPVNKISFILPDSYRDEAGNLYPVPAGRTVKFNAVLEIPENMTAEISVEYVFTGTTGDSIICDIPSDLLDEEYYFIAVIELEEDFDLQGKTQQEVKGAADDGKILFGIAINIPFDNNPRLYTLEHGVVVENFTLFGVGQ